MDDLRKRLHKTEERLNYLIRVKDSSTWGNLSGFQEKYTHLKDSFYDYEEEDLAEKIHELEDALTFIKREQKRGNTYHGIIMDPPAFGRGPDGEQWKFDSNIQELAEVALSILEPEKHFLILNTYSQNTSLDLLNKLLINNAFNSNFATGKMFIKSKTGHLLPVGVYARMESGKK